MTNQEAKRLTEKWGTSYFHPRDFKENPRIVSGADVPHVEGQDLVRAMLANVEESRRDVDNTRRLAQEADRDGMFDPDALASVPDKKTRLALVEAAKVPIGDYRRAAAELKHWREYAQWAMSKLPDREPGEDDDDPAGRRAEQEGDAA